MPNPYRNQSRQPRPTSQERVKRAPSPAGKKDGKGQAPPTKEKKRAKRNDKAQREQQQPGAAMHERHPKPDGILKTGNVVKGQLDSFTIDSQINKGGFSEIYKVHSKKQDRHFALKAEWNHESPDRQNMLRLKVETEIFRVIRAADDKHVDKSHFLSMHDFGKSDHFKFYVMDLIWMSLWDISHQVLKTKFSHSTLIHVAQQTLQSIEAIHELSHLHRDIKPHNYGVDYAPNDRIVYMIDFGTARRFRDTKGVIFVPRKENPFVGTLKWAPIAGVRDEERCRKDDLESWIYMIIALYDETNITWPVNGWGTETRRQAAAIKEHLMRNSKTLVTSKKLKVPASFCEIIEAVNRLTFFDQPNYKAIYACLDKIAAEEKVDMKLPLDWAGKVPERPMYKRNETKEKAEKAEDGAKKQSDTAGSSRDCEMSADKKKRRATRVDPTMATADDEEKKKGSYGSLEDYSELGGYDTSYSDHESDSYKEWKRNRRRRMKDRESREKERENERGGKVSRGDGPKDKMKVEQTQKSGKKRTRTTVDNVNEDKKDKKKKEDKEKKDDKERKEDKEKKDDKDKKEDKEKKDNKDKKEDKDKKDHKDKNEEKEKKGKPNKRQKTVDDNPGRK